ncbi:MupA/Atu3671 family FMN-dependent luciferase-like monooxygenase [Rhodococcus sp. IEGM 1381]|uniref:MupA/Atu3671 family FMN-dependent luciferase-like monooxygenase n=1 Tax=Rhodococcus sp. IEGM 1381 TaxID=3047085 RepID=UPI0024B7C31B|nr:MupA/Atu3671 family FMN-dependent luciferase-like monooxygenase [Rhodococcus sp. IEGM 1381]
MDLSLFYFANDTAIAGTGGRYELLLEGAKFADRSGLAAVWTPERHFHPFGGAYPNPSVLGAAIAAVTERVAIRAGSVVAPLHHPLRIAEEWAVVDNLSNGRVGLAFASGWHSVDFILRREDYENRRERVIEAVDEVRSLWGGGTYSGLDGQGRPVEVRAFPPPVQPELPVWLTAARGIETFEAAGRLKAGVLTHMLGQDPPELARKIAAYRTAAQKHHPGWNGHVVLMLHTLLGTDIDVVREQVRGPFSAYLKSSMHLIARSLIGDDIDLEQINESDMDYLVARAFDRYFTIGGLFGTVEDAQGLVESAAGLGVDEIACLVDFGVEKSTVIAGFEHLGELQRRIVAEHQPVEFSTLRQGEFR